MSGFGVEPDDMTRSVMIDDKLDALLAGRETAPGDELGVELSLMLGQLHQAFPPVVVSEQVEDTHVARMMEAAASLPAVETAAVVGLQAPLLDRIRAGLSHRIAVATLALTTAFGGAAYAGVLPGPIQRAVADLAAIVGLDLPDGDRGSDVRLPVPDGDEDGDGVHGTERVPDRGSLGGAVGKRARDEARSGAEFKDRDQRDDSDPGSDDGDEDREIENETDDDDHETDDGETDDRETDDHDTDDHDTDDHDTDDHDTDDLPEHDDDGPDDGDSGGGEEPEQEQEHSKDSSDDVKDEDETEGSSDPGSGSEEAEADPTEVQD